MKPEFTRPFSMADAKAGAPYCSANGDAVTILKWDARGKSPLVGVYGIEDYSGRWGMHGSNSFAAGHLVMLPLGMIDGKPFFVGDEIEVFSMPDNWEKMAAEPRHKKRHEPEIRWPAPAKAYPKTQMLGNDFAKVCGERIHNLGFVEAIQCANAALRHGIDSGAIVTKEDHEAGLKLLGDRLRDVAISRDIKRDMAIAKAVILACTPSLWYSLATSDDLMRIIAGIK